VTDDVGYPIPESAVNMANEMLGPPVNVYQTNPLKINVTTYNDGFYNPENVNVTLFYRKPTVNMTFEGSGLTPISQIAAGKTYTWKSGATPTIGWWHITSIAGVPPTSDEEFHIASVTGNNFVVDDVMVNGNHTAITLSPAAANATAEQEVEVGSQKTGAMPPTKAMECVSGEQLNFTSLSYPASITKIAPGNMCYAYQIGAITTIENGSWWAMLWPSAVYGSYIYIDAYYPALHEFHIGEVIVGATSLPGTITIPGGTPMVVSMKTITQILTTGETWVVTTMYGGSIPTAGSWWEIMWPGPQLVRVHILWTLNVSGVILIHIDQVQSWYLPMGQKLTGWYPYNATIPAPGYPLLLLWHKSYATLQFTLDTSSLSPLTSYLFTFVVHYTIDPTTDQNPCNNVWVQTVEVYIKLMGDIDSSGFVDYGDLTALGLSWWLGPSSPYYNPAADLDESYFIDYGDLTLLGLYWWT
jgi:hypothetical protein